MARLFEFEKVQVDLGLRTVLDIDSLATEDGGITVLAGRSGAGKSTLLRLCNRLEAPTSGVVRFRGDDIATLDPLNLRRRVGMVFQRPATFPGTVRDNLLIAAAAEYAGDEPFTEALERAGLDRSFLDRIADELSGGEAQRVCLARTLVTGPEVLLLDEPTSALDRQTTVELEARARSLAGTGFPMLWVSHDLAQAERIADEMVVLVGGRVATDEQRARFLAGGEVDSPVDGEQEGDR